MRNFSVLLAFVFPAVFAFGGANLQKKNFGEIRSVIQEISKQYKPEEILVGFDLDNTLLQTNQDLAGEQWFDWQRSILPDGKKPADAQSIATDFADLLAKQNLLLSISKMSPTETAAVELVKDLQKQGIHTMVITSRGAGEVGYTNRELRKNGFDFSLTPLPPSVGFAGFFAPVDPAHPTDAGLTAAEVEKFKLTAPRPVGYFYGVLYVEGQHKGGILRTLLKKTGSSFKAMIYVDNLKKHMGGMSDAVGATSMDLTNIHYTGLEQHLAEFNTPARQQKALQGYREFMKTLGGVFGY